VDYDIYSLGVVLLEVGRLSSFMKDRRNEEMKYSITTYKLKDIFIQKAKGLQSVLGMAYREVVLACLKTLLKKITIICCQENFGVRSARGLIRSKFRDIGICIACM
jgi:hypothetical protein